MSIKEPDNEEAVCKAVMRLVAGDEDVSNVAKPDAVVRDKQAVDLTD